MTSHIHPIGGAVLLQITLISAFQLQLRTQNKQKLSSLASSDTAAVAPSTNVSPCNVLQSWSVLTVLHYAELFTHLLCHVLFWAALHCHLAQTTDCM